MLRWPFVTRRPPLPAIPNDPRILITRLSALGDVILTLPVATALRERFPGAYLVWLVEARYKALLEGHPALNEVIAVPRRWYRSWRTITGLRRELRARSFDLVIDVQSLTKSAILGWLSGAPTRLAFSPPQGRELAPWFATYCCPPQGRHVVEVFLSLLRPLGVTNSPIRFEINETPAERGWIDKVLGELGLQGPFAVLNVGAAWQSKRWPPERFSQVARFLWEKLRLPSVILWGNSLERQAAQGIVEEAQAACRLAPPTDLRQMAALLRRARLMVSSDTGPLHLAAALGVPCVGLYGPTNPERVGPYGQGHVAVQAVRFQGRHPRSAPPDLMAAITPEMVCAACMQVLARRRSIAVDDGAQACLNGPVGTSQLG